MSTGSFWFLRDEVKIVRSEECGGLSECSRICAEDIAIIAKPEELAMSGALPRDCVIVVERID
ncbi:MAG: hypothetical protein QXN05_04075 [Acidilobaceae archaeon]